MLTAYRLLDVLFNLHSPNDAMYCNLRYEKSSQANLRPETTVRDLFCEQLYAYIEPQSHQIWPLANWIKTLQVAKTAITALRNFRDAPTADTAPSDNQPIQLKIFRDLHAIWNQESGNKILFNIQLAALHLSFMLRGPNKRLVRFLLMMIINIVIIDVYYRQFPTFQKRLMPCRCCKFVSFRLRYE